MNSLLNCGRILASSSLGTSQCQSAGPLLDISQTSIREISRQRFFYSQSAQENKKTFEATETKRSFPTLVFLAGVATGVVSLGFCASKVVDESLPLGLLLLLPREYPYHTVLRAIENKSWSEATKLIYKYEFSINDIEKFAAAAINQREYQFVIRLIKKYPFSEEQIKTLAAHAIYMGEMDEFIQYLIERNLLPPQTKFFHPAYEPTSMWSDDLPYPEFENSLLYEVTITKTPLKLSEILLEKGADFTATETGFNDRSKQISTGEKCIEFLIFFQRIDEIEALIVLSNKNLGPNALSLLEKERDYCESKACESKGQRIEEYYKLRKTKIESLIKMMS